MCVRWAACRSGQTDSSSRAEERRLTVVYSRRKKGLEKCWGRISSRLLNSSLRKCVCFSETSCQKPLLTAPPASHDFVMSREERKKKKITGREKKMMKTEERDGDGNRRKERKDGTRRQEVRGQDKRQGVEIYGGGLCYCVSIIRPYKQLKCKGGLEKAEN